MRCGIMAVGKCKNCAKLFSDEAGKIEINNPVEINANGHDLKKVEKKEADIGIAGGVGVGLLIKGGEIVKKVPEDQLLDTLREELMNWDSNKTQK